MVNPVSLPSKDGVFWKAAEAESAVVATRAGTESHTALLTGSTHHF